MRNPTKVWLQLLPRYLGALLFLFVSLMAAAQVPSITNFSPNSGPTGTTVTINGTNFTGATAVSFGNGAATATFTVVNSTTITTTVPTGAVTGRLRVTVNGITANSANNFTVTAAAPSITSISPTSGPAGTQVTIKGANLNGATAVRLGFANAGFTQVSDSIIVFSVPGTAQSGAITVTTPNGTATSPVNFVVTTATNPPTFNRFDPASASAGATILIHGNYLSGTTTVTFSSRGGGPGGGANATFTILNDSTLSVVVPTTARTGTVTIVTASGTVTSPGQFTVTVATNLPQVLSFTPTSGPTGTTVTITGKYFTGATSVTFSTGGGGGPGGGGTVTATFTVLNDSTITAIVPATAATGTISVVTSAGTGTSATNFTVIAPSAPVITSFNPTSGSAGQVVTIKGKYFLGATRVTFTANGGGPGGGTVTATYTVLNDSTITATVPATAITGTISVRNNGQTTTSTASFTVIPSSTVPQVISFTPTTGSSGTLVTIKGKYFTGSTSVTFAANGGGPGGGRVTATYTVLNDSTITVNVPATAITGTIEVITASGTGTSTTNFTVTTPGAPVITDFTPLTGPTGTFVTITGHYFTGTTRVTFTAAGGGGPFGGTVNATYNVLNDSTITTNVPATAITGNITVRNAAGTTTSAFVFTVTPAPTAPVIYSFSPTSGPTGTTVTIKGRNFTGATAASFSLLGGRTTPGTNLVVVNDSTITVDVSNRANTGPLEVTTPNGTATSTAIFTVTVAGAPVVSSFTPTSALVGATITIHGSGFTGATRITFGAGGGGGGGTNTTNFTVVNDSTITVNVPTGANTGVVSVRNANGTGTSTAVFTVLTANGPDITRFDPTSGPVGTLVTLHGKNFTGTTRVTFTATGGGPGGGTVNATFTVVNDSTITVTVPNTAATGAISVRTPNGTASTPGSYTVTVNTPVVTSFTPTSGPSGTVVTIKGKYFTAATRVGVGNTRITAFTVLNDSTISATIGATNTSGNFAVTTATGTGTSAGIFTVTNTLAITSFTPTSGPVGSLVVIKGTGFFKNGAADIRTITFNGIAAISFTVLNDTTIQVTVPTLATTGVIILRSTGGSVATSASPFTVIQPVLAVTSFSPASGPVGTVVTIKGSGFTGVQRVLFSTAVAAYTVINDSTITATVPTGAVTGNITVAKSVTSFAQSPTTFVVTVVPQIISFSPASGPVGTLVTISGNNLTGVTSVQFNGVNSAFTVVNNNSITVTVPVGATTGPITVSNGSQSGTSSTNFTVTVLPAITSFSPAGGVTGTSVTLTGTAFTGATGVTLGNVPVTSFTVVNANTITLTVPAGASTGAFTVGTAAGTGTSQTAFVIYLAPSITFFTPPTGGIGQGVTLTGHNFTGATKVTFNGVNAAFVFVDSNQINTNVPVGATTGNIAVTAQGGTGTSLTPFVVVPAPQITSFSPASGPAGTVVTVTGTNFTNTYHAYLNGDSVPFTFIDDTHYTFTVLANSTSGLVSVQTLGGTATSGNSFQVIPAPTITSFTPASGIVGTQVTVNGTGFTGSISVAFNGVSASYNLVNSNQLIATVPAGATTGNITVTTVGGTATSASAFVVIQAPVIASFSPGSGYVGTTVTVTGSYFKNASAVSLNGLAVTNYTVSAAGDSVIFAVPTGATSGLVKITTPGGTAISKNSFTVYPAPTITSFTPASGPSGTSVTIFGTTFNGTTSVTLNGTSIPFVVQDANTITATVSAGATSGFFAVTTPGGTATSANQFSVIPAPAITSFTPVLGPVGTIVTITGTEFTNATTVNFNGTSATTFTVNSATSITATVPVGATTGLIAVTTPGGTALSATSFTVVPVPNITSINPSQGFVGQSVIITGFYLNGATGVAINGTPASYTVKNADTVIATVPSGATTGPVTLVTPGGTATGPIYTVLGAPVITSISPNKGYIGTTVTLNGSGFTGVSTVTFKGVSANFTVVNDGKITAVVPAGVTSGTFTVTNPAGLATSGNFTVIPGPTLTSASPTSGFAGVTTITLTGSSLAGATSVWLGNSSANFTVVSDNSITFTVPAGAVTNKIYVVTPGGTDSLPNPFVVIGAPTIASFSPVSGPEGTVVTLTGTNFISVSSVKLNGVIATFNVLSPTTATFAVPSVALGSYNITLTTPAGTATSANVFSVTRATQPVYCFPVQTAQNCVGTFISGFAITGTTLQNNPINCPSKSGNSYSIFTAAGKYTATLNRNVTYTFTIKNGGTDANFGVWIDFNRDGHFDATEYVISSPVLASDSVVQSVTIPINASFGPTGIRIRSQVGPQIAATDTCASFATGETQDYGISIGYAPAPTVTSFTPGSGLPNTSVTIKGKNFTSTTLVSFNGVSASFNILNDSTLVANVPTAAGTGTIQVVTSSGNGTSSNTFTYIVPLTVSTSAITGTYCAGSQFNASYSSTGIFDPANRFVIQLSDSTSSFNFPTVLGSSAAASGSLQVTLPTNLVDNGNYQVRVVSTSPAIATAGSATPISVFALPTLKAGAAQTKCSGDASFTLTGFSPAGGTWSGAGVSGSKFDPATANIGVNKLTYSFTNGNGCTDTVSKFVTVNASPAKPTVTVKGKTTLCNGDSTILEGPAGFAKYVWSTGDSSQNIKVRTSGSYNLTVYNSSGCSSPASNAVVVVVNTVPPTPAISFAGNKNFCPGDSVILSAPAGYAGYLWSDGSTSQSLTIKTTSTYSVQVRNAGGCLSTPSAWVFTRQNVKPARPDLIISGDTNLCYGDSVTLIAPAGFATYSWSDGQTTQAINVKTSGSYKVYVADEIGCSSVYSNPVNVSVGNAYTIAISNSGNTSFCSGDSVVLRARNANFVRYKWSNGATTDSIVVSKSGSYSVVGITARGCTSQLSAPVQVTVNPLPTAVTIQNAATNAICTGDSIVLSANTAFGTYVWKKDGQVVQNANGRNLVAYSNGTYTVSLTNGTGCSSPVSNAVTVSVNALPAQPTVTASAATAICAGKSVTLSAPASAKYLWSNGDTTQSIVVSTAGSYSVIVKNSSGCASPASATTVVTVNAVPSRPVLAYTGSTSFCAGDSVLITAPAGFAKYAWSNGDTTATTKVKASTSLALKVLNASGCESSWSDTLNFTAIAKPANITTTGASICGSGTATISAATGFATYQWYADSSYANPIAGATSSSYTTGLLTAQKSFFVVVKNASGCASGLTRVNVNVATRPDTTVTVGTGTASVPAKPGYTYQWLLNGVPVAGATAATFTPSRSGLYSVAISNGNCSDTSRKHFITALGVEKAISGLQVSIYPNPSNGLFNLTATGLEGNVIKATVTDALGRIVHEQAYEIGSTDFNGQLDLNGMAAGIYHLQLVAGKQHATYRLRLQ